MATIRKGNDREIKFGSLYFLKFSLRLFQGFPGGASGKEPTCPMQGTWETWVWSLDGEDPPEEEMTTQSSILAWRIPWTKEPGGL